MTSARIGLLPCYLELYDRTTPDRRAEIEAFYQTIAGAFEARRLRVARAPVCRLAPEFRAALASFEKAGVDAVVTLHLAYSPSLESAPALAATRLPVIVLDTTPEYEFGPAQKPARIMYNHGIHGVQDLCNLLWRLGKPFVLEAGHWRRSDVLARVARRARAARMAAAFARARVGRLGRPFRGMGDFAVPPADLRRLGVTVVPDTGRAIGRRFETIRPADVHAELEADRARFDTAGLDTAAHRLSVRVGLAVRRWLEAERLSAFSVNFLDVRRRAGIPAVPFLEAGKAMARGIGYAGEGDVLTAALMGALLSVYPDTTFSEMFCPNWKGNTVFLSHMGEVNVSLLAGRARLQEITYAYSEADNPVKPVGCLRGGPAVWVNLAPGPGGRFRLILAPVAVQSVRGVDRMANSVHGWFRARLPVAEFLAAYSRLGGTHHAALVYDGELSALRDLAAFMGWEAVTIP